MEALTYERAMAYADDFPPSEYGTWQPRKVMQALLEIDPKADIGAGLAIGLEETPGKPAADMKFLGAEHVLSMTAIREHYDAIGNFLHVQTRKQLQEERPENFESLRKRCETLVGEIRRTLSSTIYNLRAGVPLTFHCTRCRKPMAKTMPLGVVTVEVRCFHCNALYELRGDGISNETVCSPKVTDVSCGKDGCKSTIQLWQDELQPGITWTCPDCGSLRRIGLAVLDPPPSKK